MKTYTVDATKSEDLKDNYIKFYKENDRIWLSIGKCEERAFTTDEVKKIISSLKECINE